MPLTNRLPRNAVHDLPLVSGNPDRSSSMATYTRVGTFNVYNLISADHPYYSPSNRYSPAEFEAKTDWLGAQLDRMQADVVGFQEVFHRSALQAALEKSRRFAGVEPLVVGASEEESPAMNPGVALAARPGAELLGAITEFPDEAKLNGPELSVPITSFSRPVLKAQVELFPNVEAIVFVAHLKSKRPQYAEGEDRANPLHRTLASARSLIRRAAEAAALRALLVQELADSTTPVIVLGDLNDTDRAVTTQMIAGEPPFYKIPTIRKRPYWDVLLYSAQEIQARQSTRDVYYTHIFNGFYESLDHILVSEEFYRLNPRRIAQLDYVHVLNDHLIDESQTFEDIPKTMSDHGQVVARIRLRE
jgi:hypothetical protein